MTDQLDPIAAAAERVAHMLPPPCHEMLPALVAFAAAIESRAVERSKAELLAALERAWMSNDGCQALARLAEELRREPVATESRCCSPVSIGPSRDWPCGNSLPCPLHPAPKEAARCPGPDCPLCSGEGCAKCGAGFTSDLQRPKCEHDVLERHEEPAAAPAPVPRGHCGRCDRCGGELGSALGGGCVVGRCTQHRIGWPSRSHCAGCGAPYQEEAPRCDAWVDASLHGRPAYRCANPMPCALHPRSRLKGIVVVPPEPPGLDAMAAEASERDSAAPGFSEWAAAEAPPIPFGPEPVSLVPWRHNQTMAADGWRESATGKAGDKPGDRVVVLSPTPLLGDEHDAAPDLAAIVHRANNALHASEAALRAEVERLRARPDYEAAAREQERRAEAAEKCVAEQNKGDWRNKFDQANRYWKDAAAKRDALRAARDRALAVLEAFDDADNAGDYTAALDAIVAVREALKL